MEMSQFVQLLDEYGSDIDRWPDLYREQANTLLARDVNAQQLMQAQVALEQLIDDAMYVPIPVGLANRVAKQVINRPRSIEFNWIKTIGKVLLIGVLPLMAGFALGLTNQDSSQDIGDILSESTYFNYEVTAEASNES